MQTQVDNKPYIIYLIILLLYLIPGLNVLLLGESDIYLNIIRFSALTGLVSLFISTILSNYLREVRKIFGKPFLRVHHWFAALGLILITIHPVVFAIYTASVLVFIPDFSSWYAFWSLAGRPALYLAYVATLAGILRNRTQKYWRYIHGIMYVVLGFAFVHGLLIGTNFANMFIAIFFAILLLVSYSLAVLKRIRAYRSS